MKTIHATSAEDIAAVRLLFQEYAASLATDLCFQGFAAELAGLPGAYAPPRGQLRLATVGGVAAGCAGLRPRDAHTCEMKRLYVRPVFQGRGLGRGLAQELIAEARALGYATLLLDTLPEMRGALRLYESLGFVRCAPYFDSPVAENIFMRLRLDQANGP